MLASYNNIAMPNMGLNDYEVESLLTYIDKESRRIEKYARKKPMKTATKSSGHDDDASGAGHDHSSHTH